MSATTIPSPTDVGALANRINFHTRDSHNKINADMSVKLAFAMKHGHIYRQGILAFYYIFAAVEQEIDNLLQNASTPLELQTQKILNQFWCEEFRRSNMIFQDLELLYSKEYSTRTELHAFLDDNVLPPQQQAFVEYIHQTVREKPYTILAYCHVLYLALFAGGKLMKSNIYRHTGLFPKFQHLTPEEIVRRGTNFFTFSEEGADAEGKLRWEYKKGYELATRKELTEEQKQEIIKVSSEIFDWNMDVIGELGEINRNELMGKFSFKLVSFILEEWKYSEKLSKENKVTILVIFAILQFLLAYWLLRKLF